MSSKIPSGTWVEIHRIILPAGERAPQVPSDTQKVALEMRVKGFLRRPAAAGGQAEITTAAGRTLSGRLAVVNPAYEHDFGAPIPELTPIGFEVRTILERRKKAP